jgi:hypothetical protein
MLFILTDVSIVKKFAGSDGKKFRVERKSLQIVQHMLSSQPPTKQPSKMVSLANQFSAIVDFNFLLENHQT